MERSLFTSLNKGKNAFPPIFPRRKRKKKGRKNPIYLCKSESGRPVKEGLLELLLFFFRLLCFLHLGALLPRSPSSPPPPKPPTHFKAIGARRSRGGSLRFWGSGFDKVDPISKLF